MNTATDVTARTFHRRATGITSRRCPTAQPCRPVTVPGYGVGAACLISWATRSGWSHCGQCEASWITCTSACLNRPARWSARSGLRYGSSAPKNERDGHVKARQVAGGDTGVLLVECGQQDCGPGPDRRQRVGLVGAAEKLRRHGDESDAVLASRVPNSSPNRRRRVSVVPVEEDQPGDTARLTQGVVDRVGAGRVVADQDHPVEAKRVEHSLQLAEMLRMPGRPGAFRAAVSEPIHDHHAAGREQRGETVVDTRSRSGSSCPRRPAASHPTAADRE
jgi:hypothetical protein